MSPIFSSSMVVFLTPLTFASLTASLLQEHANNLQKYFPSLDPMKRESIAMVFRNESELTMRLSGTLCVFTCMSRLKYVYVHSIQCVSKSSSLLIQFSSGDA
jgi:hypothetical protein